MTTHLRMGRRICIRCEQEFSIGSKETCPRAPDRGEHEPPDVHLFRSGRHDGLCAEPIGSGLLCGYPEWEEQLHVG